MSKTVLTFEIPTATGSLKRVRIDAADESLLEGHTWRAKADARTGKYYARCRWCRGVHKHEVLLHRLILGLVPGDRQEVDHINGDTLDNRRSNLRSVTHAENMQNVSSHRGASSKHRAVHWDSARRKWRARVHVDGRDIDLGRFDSEEAAAAAASAFRESAQPFAVRSRSLRLG